MNIEQIAGIALVIGNILLGIVLIRRHASERNRREERERIWSQIISRPYSRTEIERRIRDEKPEDWE